MLDINNYTIVSKVVSQQGKFPPQWEVTILNRENNLRYTLVCQAIHPPSPDDIFKIFCDKSEFKKHFFLEAEIVETPSEIHTETSQETAAEILKEIDIPLKTVTIDSATSKPNI